MARRLAAACAALLLGAPAGWAQTVSLGGTFGVGTVVFALVIGPLIQVFLPRLTIEPPTQPSAP